MLLREKLKVEESFKLIKSNWHSDEIEYKEMGISSLNYNGKTIIILCGNNTKQPEKAKAYANYCFSWLKGFAKKNEVTTYSIFYPNKQPLNNNMVINTAFDYKALAETIFNKILYNHGEILSADEIVKNLNDVIFMGHSIGGFIMNELITELEKMLKNNKFSKTEIKKVLSGVIFVSYSPYKLVDAEINNICIAPIYDTVGSTKLAYEKLKTCKNVVCSNPKFNFKNIDKFKFESYSEFLEVYKHFMKHEEVMYFASENTFVATPNLLYDDGIKEDHNLTGAICYPRENIHQTDAGILTSNLMSFVFSHVLSHQKENVSFEIYKQAVKEAYLYKNQNLNKEI